MIVVLGHSFLSWLFRKETEFADVVSLFNGIPPED